MSEPGTSTQFSMDPQLAAWTNHLREHELMHAEHGAMHIQLATSAGNAEKFAWETHQRMHESEQRAVDKVEVATSARFAAVNEFREQLRDQTRGFIARPEHEQVLARLSALETYRAQNEGKDRGAQPYTAILFSVASAVLSALAVGAVVIATRGGQ